MNLTTTKDAVRLGHEALKLIEKAGIAIPVSSPIRADIQLLEEHHQLFENGSTYGELLSKSGFRADLRRQAGAIEVFKRIVSLSRVGRLQDFVGSLKHFVTAGVSLASPFTDYEDLDETAKNRTRLLFEFYVASGIALNSGLAVSVAGSKDVSQKNPDVRVEGHPIQGIACKVISCSNDVTMNDRLMEGARQVCESECPTGLVAFDVRQCIDQDLLMPKVEDGYRTFKQASMAEQAVAAAIGEIGERIIGSMTEDQMNGYLEKTKSMCFIIAAQAVAIVETADGKVPTNVNVSRVFQLPFQVAYDATNELDLASWLITSPP